ncbi:MAG: alpha/beta hydrolase [Thermodesulfobacteriota bacterium]|nr:alpha/beta hydrolase [Thermodesulfobacteriota bacterium]
MNRFAYYLSGYSLKAFSGFSRARITVHGSENIPENHSLIFTANHFTRIETVLLPIHINELTKKPVWSLAASELFTEASSKILENLGAVSTKDPHRDLLIVKTLITGDASWVIFPEGMMVKNKKMINNNEFQLVSDTAMEKPHTGAATIALRTEFYRQRLKRMQQLNMGEFNRLVDIFEIKSPEAVFQKQTFIVPVNITYYPVRAKKNMLTSIALNLMEKPSDRVIEELMTEGTMLLSGVDVDVRLGQPIEIGPYLHHSLIESDLTSRRKIEFDDKLSSRPVMRKFFYEIMYDYMSSVYLMTTLNFDHVFATVLKYCPENTEEFEKNCELDEFDFKSRVYLALSGDVLKSDNYLHKSLGQNQIHILTDDRFKRYYDFMQTALSTGVVRIENGKIYKNQSVIDADTEFHTIRIKNPVAVMANEVEPLVQIHSYLKKIAEKPCDEIKRLLGEAIEKKARQDFETDYNEFFIKNESKPKLKGRPILMKNETVSLGGILLIHGYMASPAEMKPLGKYFFEKGYTVYIPRLKGHGTAPEDLAETKYTQWIESVEEGYILLRSLCDSIFVGGFSTGAGLALDLASRVDCIKAVFTVCPPMKLNDFGTNFVSSVDIWNQMMKKAHLKGLAREFVKNSPENPDINYLRNPVSGVRQLEQFMKALEDRMTSIKAPVLVVQSRKDPVVNPEGTRKLFESIGSDCREYFLFDFDRHGILLGNGAMRVYRAIADFIDAVEKKKPVSSA